MTIMEKVPAKKDENLTIPDMAGLCLGSIVIMFIVWVTLTIPDSIEKINNRVCYDHCVERIDKEFEGNNKRKLISGPSYMDEISNCYTNCLKGLNKEVGWKKRN